MKLNKTTLLLGGLAAAAIFAVSIGAQEGKKEEAKGANGRGLVESLRGFTLTLPGSQLVFLNKDDHVDVVVTFEAVMDDKRKEKVTATILQNIAVVGLRLPAKLEENGSVELAVNPNEGQYAALAVQQGSVQLLIRAAGDVEMHPMEMASFRKLFR